MVFIDAHIKDDDIFTPEVLEVTYVHMELALPRDGENTEFFKITKHLRDEIVIILDKHHDNTLLDTLVYEFE